MAWWQLMEMPGLARVPVCPTHVLHLTRTRPCSHATPPRDFYKVEIADLAAYTLLPYVVQGGLGALTGIAADRMLASGWSVRTVRVMLQVGDQLGQASTAFLPFCHILHTKAM